MQRMPLWFSTVVGIILLESLAGSRFSGAAEPGSVDFFEARIRPVLVEHCYECHSAASAEVGGSLWLDSADTMRAGGDSGPAIMPGNVQASLLVSAIRYESSEMPPGGRLPQHVINDFESWIAAGAVDPRHQKNELPVRHGKLASSGIDIEQGRQFWAFQKPRLVPPQPSRLAAGAGVTSSPGTIDAYLYERLERDSLVPNAMAPDSVRLRRLAFDLTGLPPSVELQQRWRQNPTSSNWRKIVDELLASSAFGEHWGRHWLDVARYADSNGSDFNATFHDAWRYRDYVIDSFNRDRPFDEFVRQQIAGDLMTAANNAERYDQVVATTFLMLGTKMLSERDKAKLEMDVVDEQIDTVGRALLGLTLGCARCHDHKFDPVPTQDYYALAGIFKSTTTLKGESQKYVSDWNRVTLPASETAREAIAKHDDQVRDAKAQLKAAEKALAGVEASLKTPLLGTIVDDADATKIGHWKDSTLFKPFVGKGYSHDDNMNRGESSIRFATRLPASGEYEVRVSHAPGDTRSSRTLTVIETADGPIEIKFDQRKNNAEASWSSLGKFSFVDSSDASVTLHNRDADGFVIADAVQFIPVATADGSKTSGTLASDAASQEASDLARRRDAIDSAKRHVQSCKDRLAKLQKDAPPPLPTAMAVSEAATNAIGDCHVCIRGEVRNLGPVVPRGFLQVCGTSSVSISPASSGRLELADWLTHPDHPLVSRVIVNRVWMHLMGEGIVRTVDNFGTRGELPSHPELLDALAIEFMRGDWQIKPLIREIVCSDAYNRSSSHSPASFAIDPENRSWWRMPRRRMNAESIRDAMLVVAGKLDSRPAIAPVQSFGQLVSANNSDSAAAVGTAQGVTRSIYQPVVRGYITPLMTMLDTADPDLLVGRRHTTNVPSQTLVLVNSPSVNEWSLAATKRLLAHSNDFGDRITWLYQAALHRDPTPRDIAVVRGCGMNETSNEQAWHELVTAIFASTEFRLLD